MLKKNFFYYLQSLCYLFFLPALVSCSIKNEAPVVEGWKQNSAKNSEYHVQKDDTVYSIAWAFGMDHRELARLNNLKEPYHLSQNQTLRMSASDTSSAYPASDSLPAAQVIPQPSLSPIVEAQPSSQTTSAVDKQPAKVEPTSTRESSPEVISKTKNWLWPTKGSVIRGFSAASGGNKGVDISGQLSQPIVATANGKVVYTGASLPGYGNLIIIKHSENELSAYAFNKVIVVKEGEVIKVGQTIAQMGKNDDGQAMLHFEIRRNGRPVNPMPYLSKK